MPKRHRHLPEQSRRDTKKWVPRYEEDPPRQKVWNYHDLATVKPLTLNQENMCHAFEEGHHVVAYGSAGTGKTFLAFYLALNEILSPHSKQTNIILVRSAVQGRDMGFLPGTLEEKMALYEIPYRDVLYEIVGRFSTYEDMKKGGLIQFCTTSFLRSLTWNNAIVIMDEVQNMSFHEIHSTVTRLGEHSRLLVLGDMAQNDLAGKKNEQSGMERFLKVARCIPSFSMIHFTRDDIIRSDFVKAWIIAVEETS